MFPMSILKKIKALISIYTIHLLSVVDFAAIRNQAHRQGVNGLCIAMELSLQTSPAVNEISKLKYADIEKHSKTKKLLLVVYLLCLFNFC